LPLISSGSDDAVEVDFRQCYVFWRAMTDAQWQRNLTDGF